MPDVVVTNRPISKPLFVVSKPKKLDGSPGEIDGPLKVEESSTGVGSFEQDVATPLRIKFTATTAGQAEHAVSGDADMDPNAVNAIPGRVSIGWVDDQSVDLGLEAEPD